MKNKTEQVKSLLSAGDDTSVRKALGILAKFRLGISKAESRSIQIVHESLAGNARFYVQLGIDLNREQQVTKAVIKRMYGVSVEI